MKRFRAWLVPARVDRSLAEGGKGPSPGYGLTGCRPRSLHASFFLLTSLSLPDMRKPIVAIALVASLLQLPSCSRDEDARPSVARGHGRVKIVYDDAGIKPENRDVVKQIRDSHVFDRLADRATKTLALPHDLEVKVSDDVPFDDPSTDVYGKTIFWPAGWLNTTRMLLVEFVPEVTRDKGVPKAIGAQNFTPDTLNIWANQFILGHELGHALIHQLTLPMTGMEEDSADGFATFFTIIDKETG